MTYPDGACETYAYDALGNLIGSTDALGAETQYAYDASSLLSQVTYANGAQLTIDYDKAGNITEEADALGAVQTYAYDAVGRMTAVTDALGNVTQYAYDAGDNLAKVTDANGNGTSYTYDLNGNLTSETDALGNTIRYSYTPEGWLSKITKADGETIAYTYDKTGNVLSEDCAGTRKTENSYNELGKVVTTTSAEGETKYQYDDQGNLIYVKTPNNEVVSYTYDEYGRKESLRYPDGESVFYEYDQMDRLIAVKGLDGTKTEYTYNAAGQRTKTSDGKLTTEYGYDVIGNLTEQKTTGRTEISFEYLYDLNNRMLSETRSESGASIKSEYVYDKLGQIQSFQTSDGHNEAYTYDAAGNMTQKSVNGLAIYMTYNAANELETMQSEKGSISYSYDQNGNLTQKELDGKKDTYTYDVLNRLTSYVGYDGYAQNYTYNAQSMMSAKESKGNPNRQTMEEIVSGKKEEPSADDDDPDPAEWVKTSYTYDVTAPYYEVLTETTGKVTTSYDYGIERLSAYSGSSAWNTIKTQYVYDGRGSVAQELSNNNSWYTFGGALSQTTKNSYSYTPLGELLSGTTAETTFFAYNGESYDSSTGMVNLRARWYEPATMRFSQRDIIKGDQAAPISLNRYLYCENNPINFIDPSGKSIAELWNKAKTAVSNGVSAVKTAAKNVVSTVTNTVKSVGNWVNENKKTIAKVAVGALAVAALVGITVLTGGAALAVAGSYLATATVFTAGFLAGGIVSKYAGSVISNIDRTDTFREASDRAAKATTKALPGIAITSAITGLLMPLGTPLVKEALRPLGLAATKFAASAFEGYADDAVSVVDDFVDDASSAYAGAQSSGATQSGNAGTTACTEAGQVADDVATGAGNGGYQAPVGGGGVSNAIRIGDNTITFGHGGRHIAGLDVSTVEQTIANNVPKIAPGEFFQGSVNVNGVNIIFRAFGRGEGVINNGTYFIG